MPNVVDKSAWWNALLTSAILVALLLISQMISFNELHYSFNSSLSRKTKFKDAL